MHGPRNYSPNLSFLSDPASAPSANLSRVAAPPPACPNHRPPFRITIPWARLQRFRNITCSPCVPCNAHPHDPCSFSGRDLAALAQRLAQLWEEGAHDALGPSVRVNCTLHWSSMCAIDFPDPLAGVADQFKTRAFRDMLAAMGSGGASCNCRKRELEWKRAREARERERDAAEREREGAKRLL